MGKVSVPRSEEGGRGGGGYGFSISFLPALTHPQTYRKVGGGDLWQLASAAPLSSSFLLNTYLNNG